MGRRTSFKDLGTCYGYSGFLRTSTSFHVIRDIPVDVMIGIYLLEQCEVDINFQTKALSVGRLPFHGHVPPGTLG